MKLIETGKSFLLAALLVLSCTFALGEAEDPGRSRAVRTDAVMGRLCGNSYELIIDQAYCDGRKLYYSYQLTQAERKIMPIEEQSISCLPWDQVYPGERAEQVIHSHLGEEADREIVKWMNEHECAYIEVDYTYVGDGADLPDGTSLMPVDSLLTREDDRTMMAFYEVELPDGFYPGETLDFVLNVMTTTTAYYLDETGVYQSARYQPDKLVRVPVNVPVTGKLTILRGMGTADGYPAYAELFVSDIDISGTVRIDAPEDYEAEGYDLDAGGVRLKSFEPTWTRYDGEGHVMQVRYDLPEKLEQMRLVPQDPAYEYEAILLD